MKTLSITLIPSPTIKDIKAAYDIISDANDNGYTHININGDIEPINQIMDKYQLILMTNFKGIFKRIS